MIAKILLTLFLVVMVVVFIWSTSRPPPEAEIPDFPDMDIACPRRADPEDCRSYFDCLDIRYECGIMELFDTTTNQCRQFYYDVDCGNRPQPLEPTVTEICYPYVNGFLPFTHFLPRSTCNNYIDCNWSATIQRSCDWLSNFDDKTFRCVFQFQDCGNRT
ncbi:chit-2b [Spodoptera frugiperda granulovirus]|uniref:Chit-2b n=1 Tax=Spodoptera frugiperda granulovirus TaxID=307454 RepID=A0A0C5AUV9_9BBAC|nr:chit-2b [Spodoptera frugiperda granulovirus]AJK91733.1 chit-2b [Spodoptera frugiperda granulovirus]